MLIVAQRVVSKTHRVQGVNAYRYRHDPSYRPEDPRLLFGDVMKTAQRRTVELHPGGNRVISFLDVAAPEDTPLEEIIRHLNEFKAREVPATFPTECVVGRCAVRFGLEQRLLPLWREEFDELMQHIASV